MVGATEVHLTDPYFIHRYQQKNLHEFCRMLLEMIPLGEELTLKVFTAKDKEIPLEHKFELQDLADSFNGTPLTVLIELNDLEKMHDRYIESDNGWKMILGRGLDIFQRMEYKNAYDLAKRMQTARRCRGFEVTYVKR